MKEKGPSPRQKAPCLVHPLDAESLRQRGEGRGAHRLGGKPPAYATKSDALHSMLHVPKGPSPRRAHR